MGYGARLLLGVLLLAAGCGTGGSGANSTAASARGSQSLAQCGISYHVTLPRSGLEVYRDRCLEVAGIDVMVAAEECVADTLVRNRTQAGPYPPRLVEVVPTDLLNQVVAERGLLVETSDDETVIAFTVDALHAQRLERIIERQLRAQRERLGSETRDVTDAVRSRGNATYWGNNMGPADPFPRCFH